MIGKNSRLGMIGFLIVVLVAGLAMVTKVQSQDQSPATANTETEPQAVQAIPPILFNYQGRLLNSSGEPINNSAVPMVFELFGEVSGGTNCWKESHTGGNGVKIEEGVFQVVLGQLKTISTDCATGEKYLQLTVNGEVMKPRERLTAVATAVQANSLTDNATVAGDLNVDGAIVASPENSGFYLRNDNGPIRIASSQSVHVYLDTNNDSAGDAFTVSSNNDSHDPPLITNIIRIGDNGIISTLSDVVVGGNLALGLDGNKTKNVALRYDKSRLLHLVPYGGSQYQWDNVCIGCGAGAGLIVNGTTRVNGDLELHGPCKIVSTGTGDLAPPGGDCSGGNLTTAAIIEANLQTPDEMNSERIERFSEGDVLCWAGEQLEKCAKEDDRLVQAVASVDGRPIIIGAENIRVIGPVEMGDILVSSTIPGYAMVNNDPVPGTVIAQALEDLQGESGLIKAMIRKW